ncbi:GSCOCG00006087001-RA-CDS [Cotesia congregata]|nr:GSCOCG00006087001-RA-CDS [Cotesia congregata]
MEINNVGNNNKSLIHLAISFRKLCIATACLPLVTLLICFVTAYIFQQDDIHETHCRVYNVLPSISAITGVSPQRYLWRVTIALHIGPRLVIATVYHSYYRKILTDLEDLPKKLIGCRLLNLCFWLNIIEIAALCGVTYISNRENYSTVYHSYYRKILTDLEDLPKKLIGCRLLNLCFWLNIIEIAALCGVTYISNRENYYAHEKIFIMFMVSSLTYMLAAVKLGRLLTPNAQSLHYKQILFTTSIVSTIGLIIFFLKHRLLCHDLAFSWFSLCEYIIASANMGFHVTVIMDFPKEQLIVGYGLPATKVD